MLESKRVIEIGEWYKAHPGKQPNSTEWGFSKRLRDWYRGHIILPVFASYTQRPGGFVNISHKIITEAPPMALWL